MKAINCLNFKHIASIFILLLLSMFLLSFFYKNNVIGDGLQSFNADSLKGYIRILSSDEYEGRKPFTRAETKTINYLQEQFKRLGLQPGNNGSYFQDIPMVNIATNADPEMKVVSKAGEFSLKGFDDYVIWTEKSDPKITITNAPLVFAGYGVVAPEYKWNDYANLDVKGKIVVVMVNDPGFGSRDTSMFKGTTMTYYGRWTYKYEEAARQGAIGCLIVHNTLAASYPFSVVQNNWNSSKLHLDDRGKNAKYCDMVGWVSEDAAKRLFKASGRDSSLLRSASKRGFKPIELGLSISTGISVKATYNLSHNVIATIPGTKRPDEYIIYTAHWDHLGFGKPDETGDSIYNGALDNASGTAGLIELARAYKSLETKPERTIVFLSVTAEEQGLWGSAYYAQNPIFPIKKTVANINMDGLNPDNKTNDVIIVGAGQSELEGYLEDAAKTQGRYIAKEDHSEGGSYYRSDHFNFAKVGIPALYAKTGVDIVGKGTTYGKKVHAEYVEKHYHRPSDQYHDEWTFNGGIEDLKLLFLVGKRLASESTMPQWKQGSEFKSIREK